MSTFETGKTYFGRFACNSDATDTITVAKRTEKTLTTTKGKRLKIHRSTLDGSEFVFPHGRYSMAMVIGADKELAEA